MHAFCMPFPERLITISGEVSFKIVKRLSSVKGVFMLWWVSIDYRVKTEKFVKPLTSSGQTAGSFNTN